MTLIQIGSLALVTLVLALTVVRPILTRPMSATARGGFNARPASADSDRFGANAPASVSQPGLPAPDDDRKQPAASAEALRLAVAGRPDQTVSMLRDWLAPAEYAGSDTEAVR
jgi:hypothetical protein